MADYMSFKDNEDPVEVTLTYDQPNESVNSFGKKQFTYGIEEINGCDKFSATEKLHEKIQVLGVGTGDTIVINKVKDPAINQGYAFFKADLPDNKVVPKSAEAPKEPVVEEPLFPESPKEPVVEEAPPLPKKTAPIETELSPSKKVEILWKWYQSETIEKGHKPGDELI